MRNTKHKEKTWKYQIKQHEAFQVSFDLVLTLYKETTVFKIYRIHNTFYKTIETFINACIPKILPILSISHKVIYTLKFTLFREELDSHGKPLEKTKDHHEVKPNFPLVEQEHLLESTKELVSFFTKALANLETSKSGWALKSIDFLDINLVKFKPLRGGCIGKLPKNLKDKKFLIGMEDNTQQCLKWAITLLAFENNERKDKGRITKELKRQAKTLDWRNIGFPAGVQDLKQFEKNNPHIAIYVYGKQDSEYFIMYNGFHLRPNPEKKNFLFYYNHHYFPIVNTRAFNAWILNSAKKKYVCYDCLTGYTTPEFLKEHKVYC